MVGPIAAVAEALAEPAFSRARQSVSALSKKGSMLW
jgi:hypothetical protein